MTGADIASMAHALTLAATLAPFIALTAVITIIAVFR
jgi:hypothetical protein